MGTECNSALSTQGDLVHIRAIGSYNLEYQVMSMRNGVANVHFYVKNSSTMQSASRPPIIGYWPIWKNSVGDFINDYFSTGWGSKTTQTFSWNENLILRK